MSKTQPPPLLNLPQELLDRILTLLIPTHMLHVPVRHPSSACPVCQLPSIMQVCHKLRADAAKIIFSREIEFWDTKWAPLDFWMKDVVGEYRRRLAKLRIASTFVMAMERAKGKAVELERRYELKAGTVWILSYTEQNDEFEQLWINATGDIEQFKESDGPSQA